ncbi:hypothetical protein OHA99_26725 [Streptomyces coelicoflavus]|uniref:hypothetical protein n=1 Tax=Streptomyces coelicoflavus TaxID=285562 RepID=UPI00324DB06D
MGSQDQHRPNEPETTTQAPQPTAVERRAAQAEKVRQVDAHRRVVQAQRTAGADVPDLDDLLGGDAA